MATDPNLTKQQQVALNKQKFVSQIGKSGVVIVDGIISQEEYNKDLYGKLAIKVYNEMRRGDGTVRAALMVVKLMIMAAEWDCQVATGTDAAPVNEAEAQTAHDIVYNSLWENNNFESILREALLMTDFGYSVFEQVFESGLVDNKEYILLKDLLFMKQKTIYRWNAGQEMNELGEAVDIPGVTQQLINGTSVQIPWAKLSVFTFDKEGDNFEGISLLRAAYKHWYLKDKMYLIDAVRVEKQGLGVLKVKVPADAKEDDKEKAREIAEEQRASESGYIEEAEGYEFDFMDMKANTTADAMPSIQHHDRMIMDSVLAQFMSTSSQGSKGSLTASTNQYDLFITSEDATAKIVQAVLNDTVVRNLMELNGIARENWPKITYGRIGKDSIEQFSTALQRMFQSGAVTPDPELEAYVRKILHLPPMPTDLADNYDQVRNARKPAPATPGTPVTGSEDEDGLSETDANWLIKRARDVRDRLLGVRQKNASKRKTT